MKGELLKKWLRPATLNPGSQWIVLVAGGGMTKNLSRSHYEILKSKHKEILANFSNLSETQYLDQQDAKIYLMVHFMNVL